MNELAVTPLGCILVLRHVSPGCIFTKQPCFGDALKSIFNQYYDGDPRHSKLKIVHKDPQLKGYPRNFPATQHLPPAKSSPYLSTLYGSGKPSCHTSLYLANGKKPQHYFFYWHDKNHYGILAYPPLSLTTPKAS